MMAPMDLRNLEKKTRKSLHFNYNYKKENIYVFIYAINFPFIIFDGDEIMNDSFTDFSMF